MKGRHLGVTRVFAPSASDADVAATPVQPGGKFAVAGYPPPLSGQQAAAGEEAAAKARGGVSEVGGHGGSRGRGPL